MSPLTKITTKPEKLEPSATGRLSVRYVDIGLLDGPMDNLNFAPEITSESAPARCRQVIAHGDTLYATVRPYLRKIAHVGRSLDAEFASTGYCVLRPTSSLDPKFLYFACLTPQFEEQLLPMQRGVSYPAVRDKEVRAQSIAYPNLQEQRRIVEILEDHLSRLDAADRLLARGTTRLNALEELLLARTSDGPLKTLKDLTRASGYGTSEKCVVDGRGVAVVRIPNLRDGLIELEDEKRVADKSADVSRSMLSAGDLLIVRTNGSVNLIGRSAVVQEGITAAFASYLIRYRLHDDLVRPRWVQAMLSAPHTRRKIESLAASSAGQYNLSLSKLDPLEIPVPPLDEQDARLARLDEHRSAIKVLESELARSARKSDAMRRAVLAAAFSGNLTGRHTDDEAIEELADAGV